MLLMLWRLNLSVLYVVVAGPALSLIFVVVGGGGAVRCVILLGEGCLLR